jgi:hypothetical protein
MVANPPTCLSEQVAQHFGGRRVSSSRWMARCPAHADKSPSLSIAEGRDGRALVRCFAGCTLDAVLQAAGLTIQSLFPGPAPAPEKFAAISAERSRKLEEERVRRAMDRSAIADLRGGREELAAQLPILARQLMQMPEGARGEKALTRYFHDVLAQIRFIDRSFEGEAAWVL